MEQVAARYLPAEIDAIAQWLRDGATAREVTLLFSERFRTVSRSGIISIVHRNKSLKAIGFAHNVGGASTKTGVSRNVKQGTAAVPRQHLHAGNIRGKLEGRKFDPCLPDPTPRSLDDGVSPHVYDGASRALRLVDLGSRDCRFPINQAEPGVEHLFCGRPTAIGRPYCRHHCRRAGAGYRAEAA